jgi:diadenosine tetraphosphate (Ap4A) HIT family hydrolase
MDRRGEVPIDCPFCRSDRKAVIETEFALAVLDGYPVAEGHTLVIPRRHVASLFDLPEEEQAAIWRLVADVRRRLADQYRPDGFNIGLNDGQAAGQTVMHAHVHVTPRRRGDVADPKGGVRWVVPDKAAYWGDKR